MRKTGMSRILAMVLCIAMLVPNFTFLASALERSGGTTVLQPTKADPLAVVCAGSDIQYLSTSYNGVEYPDKYAVLKSTASLKSNGSIDSIKSSGILEEPSTGTLSKPIEPPL